MTDALIEIRPEVAIYSAFARLNYKPWYALSEFVDNSLQSFLANRAALGTPEKPARLDVDIKISESRIEITDNAAGIAWPDFPRAFLPASPPPDTSGLSEYGLGMKAAACWFARHWSVRTKAIMDPVERIITFDIPRITAQHMDRLPIVERPSRSSAPGTTVTLEQLNVHPRLRTIDKIKRHLASIYRLFLRNDTLRLRVNDDVLVHVTPPLLEAPYFLYGKGPPQKWLKEFSLSLDDTHRIWGWAGILSKASVTNAGFAIFRRQRLIEGSYGEAYRPEMLFRKSNSYTYQRLVGELFVEGFTVSHTKDGVQWEEWEEDLLRWLRNELDREPLPLLKQAEGHRVGRLQRSNSLSSVANDTQHVVAQRIPPLVEEQLGAPPDTSALKEALPEAILREQRNARFRLQHAGQDWQVDIELISDEAIYQWLDIAGGERGSERRLRIRVNLAHPFMVRFSTPTGSELTPLIRIAVGIAVAEATARATGVDRAGTLRRNLNQLLREALSAPAEELEEEGTNESEE